MKRWPASTSAKLDACYENQLILEKRIETLKETAKPKCKTCKRPI